MPFVAVKRRLEGTIVTAVRLWDVGQMATHHGFGSNKGEDRIEFALDINIRDVMFERVARAATCAW